MGAIPPPRVSEGGVKMTDETSHETDSILLIFRLEGEAFGVSVGVVHEILDSEEMTDVPNADPFSPGLINVRGSVVPVVDVRRRLGMGPAKRSETSRKIVLEHMIDGLPTTLAFEADAVEEVFEANLDQLETVPELGASWPQVYLQGTLRRDEELIVLLNTDTLFVPNAA